MAATPAETGTYDGTWRQVDATDCRILCNALRTIEAFWQKVQLLKSCGVDPEDGFALEKFEESIRQGGALAQRYLGPVQDTCKMWSQGHLNKLYQYVRRQTTVINRTGLAR